MQIFYDKDCDLSIIQSKKVAIIGYGSQGHAHALNLKDSGVDVTVGLRANSASWKKAENSGLKVAEVPAAVAQADVVMILTPDEFQSQLYRDVIEPNIKQGATLAFAHGFSILYNQVVPRADLDVIMVAPKAPGPIWKKAENSGLKVAEVPAAVAQADVVMILTPDEFQSQLYRDVIEPNIKQGATLAFAHGFSILYNQVVPRADLDVIMVAPKAPGHT